MNQFYGYSKAFDCSFSTYLLLICLLQSDLLEKQIQYLDTNAVKTRSKLFDVRVLLQKWGVSCNIRASLNTPCQRKFKNIQ